MLLTFALAALTAPVLQDPAPAPEPAPAPATEEPAPDPFAPKPITAIDVYGTLEASGGVAEALVRARAELAVGDLTDFDRDAVEARLRALEGVRDASVMTVLMPGAAIVMIGIDTPQSPRLALLPEPTGEQRLPAEMLQAYERASDLLMEGILSGEGGEDVVDGYSVPRYVPLAEAEAELRELALAQPDRVRGVLAASADATHRAVAAKALAYLPDKAAVVRGLSGSMLDPDPAVRNNAVRALGIFADWVVDMQPGPERERLVALLGEHLGVAPLVTMLSSFEWTDRNKSAALLARLVELPLESVHQAVRAEGLVALGEMAAWSSRGHALFSTRILANLAGRDVDEVFAADRAAREAGRLGAFALELVRAAEAAGGEPESADEAR